MENKKAMEIQARVFVEFFGFFFLFVFVFQENF